jgi:hypothetical protein
MSHYHIDIPIDAEDVKILKRDFKNFIEDSGGFTLEITPDGDNDPASPELAEVLSKLFLKLVTHLVEGKFKGLN